MRLDMVASPSTVLTWRRHWWLLMWSFVFVWSLTVLSVPVGCASALRVGSAEQFPSPPTANFANRPSDLKAPPVLVGSGIWAETDRGVLGGASHNMAQRTILQGMQRCTSWVKNGDKTSQEDITELRNELLNPSNIDEVRMLLSYVVEEDGMKEGPIGQVRGQITKSFGSPEPGVEVDMLEAIQRATNAQIEDAISRFTDIDLDWLRKLICAYFLSDQVVLQASEADTMRKQQQGSFNAGVMPSTSGDAQQSSASPDNDENDAYQGVAEAQSSRRFLDGGRVSLPDATEPRSLTHHTVPSVENISRNSSPATRNGAPGERMPESSWSASTESLAYRLINPPTLPPLRQFPLFPYLPLPPFLPATTRTTTSRPIEQFPAGRKRDEQSQSSMPPSWRQHERGPQDAIDLPPQSLYCWPAADRGPVPWVAPILMVPVSPIPDESHRGVDPRSLDAQGNTVSRNDGALENARPARERRHLTADMASTRWLKNWQPAADVERQFHPLQEPSNDQRHPQPFAPPTKLEGFSSPMYYIPSISAPVANMATYQPEWIPPVPQDFSIPIASVENWSPALGANWIPGNWLPSSPGSYFVEQVGLPLAQTPVVSGARPVQAISTGPITAHRQVPHYYLPHSSVAQPMVRVRRRYI